MGEGGFCLVMGKQLGHGTRESQPDLQPQRPSRLCTIPGARHKIWDLFSHSPASWGLSHIGLKADFYKIFSLSRDGASKGGREITWDEAKPETGPLTSVPDPLQIQAGGFF